MTNSQLKLFECLLQGMLREASRVYWNTTQKIWAESMTGCMCWWPDNPRDFQIGEVFKLKITQDYSRALITCGGHTVSVEITGKRIGMYGPSCDMTEEEIVKWFNKTLEELETFNKTVTTFVRATNSAIPIL